MVQVSKGFPNEVIIISLQEVIKRPLKAGILKTDLWPVQTDLEIFRPIYFASNVILSVR